jgi:hypothetical protein
MNKRPALLKTYRYISSMFRSILRGFRLIRPSLIAEATANALPQLLHHGVTVDDEGNLAFQFAEREQAVQ